MPGYPWGVNLHLNPCCLPAHPSTPALYTDHHPPLPPLFPPPTLRVHTLYPHPLHSKPPPVCDGGIRLNSHRAAGDTWMFWNQLLLRKKRLTVCFYNASGLFDKLWAAGRSQCALAHVHTQYTAWCCRAGGIWAEWVCLRDGAADTGSHSYMRMWAESECHSLLRQMRGNDGEMER